MAKKCPNCGNVLEDDVKFCDECGTNVEQNPANHQNEMPLSQESTKINMYENLQTENIMDNEKAVNGSADIYADQSTFISTKAMMQKETTDSKILGIVALAFGILSIITLGCLFLPEIVAVVCGMFSKDSNGRITQIGKAGLICGIIGCALVMLIFFL